VKKRQLLIFTQTCLILNALVTALLVSTGVVHVWHLAALAVFQGSVLSFNQPSRQAYLIELVSAEERSNAIALYNSGQTCVRIVAPSVAGLLISLSFVGLTYVFYFITACYFVPVVLLLLIRTRPAEFVRKSTAMVFEFKEGLRYIAQNDVLKVIIIAGIVPPLLGNSYQQLLPVFASPKVLAVGASGLGLMSTVSGLGGFFGSMTVASFGNIRRRGLAQLIAGALFGVALVAFGLTRDFTLALVALAAVGFAASLYQTLNATLLATATDQAYFGRVTSVQQLNQSLNSVATLPIGYAVDQFGAPSVVMFNGCMVTLFWCIVGLFVRSYRRIEMQPQSSRTPT
jgi:MFS family permease